MSTTSRSTTSGPGAGVPATPRPAISRPISRSGPRVTPSAVRLGRGVAGLAALALLAGCSTTVSGTGRPGAGVRDAASGFPSGAGSSSAPSGSGSASRSPGSGGTGSGEISASGDPHDVWESAIEATTGTGGTVDVAGTISGAGVSSAKITGSYSVDAGGDPVTTATVVVDKGSLSILATGGDAWAESTAAVYEEYGYDDDGSVQADGKEVVITDDDSGLDVYTALDTFLTLCGPDPADDASLTDGTYQGKAVVVVHDDKYGTKSYVDPSNGHVLASEYEDETVVFTYRGTPTTVTAPPSSTVVTVDGF